MFLADYHVHSSCSFDAKNRMFEMAAAASRRGISELCFTDHADIGVPETLQIGPIDFSLPGNQAHQYIEAMEKAPEGIFMTLGLELGAPNHMPEVGKRIFFMPEYDFILGALHNLRGKPDFYEIRYRSEEHCLELYDAYLDELIEIAELGCFDVMAHIGYCVRYMRKYGFDINITYDRFGDKLDYLLRTIIDAGKGIELNTADLVPGGRQNPLLAPLPTVEILNRYKELGGDIITVGSDAHNVNTVGIGIAEGYELLRDIGFSYVTLYKRHKPEFKRI
ncbi:MAG: histidinol-phosphatase HisJ family protein [Ruminococcaceae bacterium]|nr:histidinol-phosphatase HisJ family protein [Oscillospiraceae bacterium]